MLSSETRSIDSHVLKESCFTIRRWPLWLGIGATTAVWSSTLLLNHWAFRPDSLVVVSATSKSDTGEGDASSGEVRALADSNQ
jgi:hypothetical protein